MCNYWLAVCRPGKEECILRSWLSMQNNAASGSDAGGRVVKVRVENGAPLACTCASRSRAFSCCSARRGESNLGGISGGVIVDYLVNYSKLHRSSAVRTSRLNTSQVNLFRCLSASVVCYCLLANLSPRPSQLESCDSAYSSERRAASIAPVGREPP